MIYLSVIICSKYKWSLIQPFFLNNFKYWLCPSHATDGTSHPVFQGAGHLWHQDQKQTLTTGLIRCISFQNTYDSWTQKKRKKKVFQCILKLYLAAGSHTVTPHFTLYFRLFNKLSWDIVAKHDVKSHLPHPHQQVYTQWSYCL